MGKEGTAPQGGEIRDGLDYRPRAGEHRVPHSAPGSTGTTLGLRSPGTWGLTGHRCHPSLSVPVTVQSLVCEAPAPASFRLPQGHQRDLGRDREEADLHEAPSPNGLGGVKRPRGHLPAAQEPEEATSCEGPPMACMVLLLGVLTAQVRGGGSAALGGT